MENKKGVLVARHLYYTLFADLFLFTMRDDRFANIYEILKTISASPLDDESANAISKILPNFTHQNLQNVIEEYDDIFHTPPHPLHNTFSYYEEGYEAGRACVRVRKILAKTDIRRDEEIFKENEDSIGFVFTLMAEFIKRELDGEEIYDEYQKELFQTIINPFVDEFIVLLFEHESSDTYKEIAVILQAFIEFERLFYALAKPIYENEKKIKTQNGISRSEALRREQNRARRKAERSIDAKEQ